MGPNSVLVLFYVVRMFSIATENFKLTDFSKEFGLTCVFTPLPRPSWNSWLHWLSNGLSPLQLTRTINELVSTLWGAILRKAEDIIYTCAVLHLVYSTGPKPQTQFKRAATTSTTTVNRSLFAVWCPSVVLWVNVWLPAHFLMCYYDYLGVTSWKTPGRALLLLVCPVPASLMSWGENKSEVLLTYRHFVAWKTWEEAF